MNSGTVPVSEDDKMKKTIMVYRVKESANSSFIYRLHVPHSSIPSGMTLEQCSNMRMNLMFSESNYTLVDQAN